MYSRRDLGRVAIAALPLSGAFGEPNSVIGGVRIGAQSYSFRDRGLDEAIQALLAVGLSECELWQGHVEPNVGRGKEGEAELKRWRETVSLDHFKNIGKKFKNAGIRLNGYNYSFRDGFSDKEIERGFEFAKALGAPCITASATVSVTRRVAPYAARAKMVVGMHGHDNLKDSNEFAKPESFETAMSDSKWIGVNLDIGHFTAAGYDAPAFLEKYHDRIVTLHIKDRRKGQGPNMPFGEGDTPIKETLQLLRTKRYRIPANIEYEYKAQDAVEEVKKCYAFCKAALA